MTNRFDSFIPGPRALSRMLLMTLLAFGRTSVPAETPIRIGDNTVLPTIASETRDSIPINFAPAIAFDSNNSRYLVVWTATDDDSNEEGRQYNHVVGMLLDSDGQEVKPQDAIDPLRPFEISKGYNLKTTPLLGGSNPSVVFNPKQDHFFVTYRRTYSGSQKPGILAQIVEVKSDGTLTTKGSEIQILASGNNPPTTPVLTYDNVNTRYLVVWSAGGDISGSLLEGSNPPTVGSAISMATDAQHPALAFDSQSGEYLLAYDAFSTSSNSQDIFAKRFSATGQILDNTAITVTSDPSIQTTPRVAYNPDGNEYAVLWNDGRNTATSGQNVYGRIVSAQGALPATEHRLVGYSTSPALGWAQSEQLYLLDWTKQQPTAAKDGFLFGRMLGTDLSTTEFPAVFSISDRGGAQAGARSVAFDGPNSRALVAWARSSTGGQSIVTQLLDVSVRVTTMKLQVTDVPDPVKSGSILTYTITVTNTGTATARGITVTDTLPLGATLPPPTATQGIRETICTNPNDPDTTPVECSFELDTVKPGAAIRFELPVQLKKGQFGSIVNKAELDWTNKGGTATKIKSTKTQISYPGELTVTISDNTPNDKSVVLHPGEPPPDLTWNIADAVAVNSFDFKTEWSIDNGKTWKPMAGNAAEGTEPYTWNQPWSVPIVPGNRTQAKIRVTGTATIDSDGQPSAVPIEPAESSAFAIEVVKLSAPDGADPVNAGSSQSVRWNYYGTKSPVDTVRLQYSTDNGRRWKLITNVPADPAGSETWNVPLLTRNAAKAAVRIKLLTSGGRSVGSDRSDATFAIRVLELTGPSGTISGGDPESITWKTYITGPAVAGWKLLLTKDNGSHWKTVGEDSGNPEAHTWTVPALKKRAGKCKLRLILTDSGGKTIATDTQTGFFRIAP